MDQQQQQLSSTPEEAPILAPVVSGSEPALPWPTTANTITNTTASESILQNIIFRDVCPTDLPTIYKLERASYPKDEAASKSQIQYRQHHAALFFRCAVYIAPQTPQLEDVSVAMDEDDEAANNNSNSYNSASNNNYDTNFNNSNTSNGDDNDYDDSTLNSNDEKNSKSIKPMGAMGNSINGIGTVIGFITATRCSNFTAKSMSTHDPNGNLLAVHSLVVQKEYRNLGIGEALMKNYIRVVNSFMEEKIDAIISTNSIGNSSSSGSGSGSSKLIEKIVLLSKINNLPFYVKLGFQVAGKSQIEHGTDDWYDCVQDVDVVKKYLLRQKEHDDYVKKYGRAGNSLYWIVDSFAIPTIQMSGGKGGGSRRTSSKTDLIEGATAVANDDNFNANANTNATFSTLPCGTSAASAAAAGYVVSYKRGSGNPAAVVLVPHATPMIKTHLSQRSTPTAFDDDMENDPNNFDPTFEDNVSWMKNIAKEFNLSETAFIWKSSHKIPRQDDDSAAVATTTSAMPSKMRGIEEYHYNIRFYTSNGTEVDLCGHATLAASSVIFQQFGKEMKNFEGITFHAKNDVILRAKPGLGNVISASNQRSHALSRMVSNNHSLRILIDFPVKKVNAFGKDTELYASVLSMLKNSFFYNQDDSTTSQLDIEDYVHFVGVDDGQDDLLIELSSEGFSNIPRYSEDIDFKPMLELDGYNRGIILCCEVSDDYRLYGETADFMSRFFGPKVGIYEDPVTGSAHCVLGPYYSAKLGKVNVTGAQKSLRGGIVECEMKEDGVIQIAGTAVTVMIGNLYM